MKPVRQIPKSREEDVLHLYWQLLGALESRVGNPKTEPLDAELIRASYNVLNDIGYTTARPRWERT